MSKYWKSAVDGFRDKNKSRVWKSSKRKRVYKKSSYRRPARTKRAEKWTSDDTIGLLIIIGLIILGGLFGKILPFLIIIVIFGIVIYFIYKSNANSNEMFVSEERIAEINRLFEIISESQNLVNNSPNIETVKTRLDLILKMINTIDEYEEYELQAAGYTKSKMQEQRDFICDKYDIVINQSIERAYEKEIRDALELKTVSGRNRRIQRFFSKIKEVSWLTNENMLYIYELEEKHNAKE